MSFKVIELKRNKGYTFLIGTSERTSPVRERIERALAGVWNDLFAGSELVSPYGFELIPDSTAPDGLPALPGFERGKTYLVFVLAESETAVSEEKERETTNGVLRAIGSSLGEGKSRATVGVITLYNCSVSVLESDAVRPGGDWLTPEEFVRATTRIVKRGEPRETYYRDDPPLSPWR